MKRVLTLATALAMLVGVVGCGATDTKSSTGSAAAAAGTTADTSPIVVGAAMGKTGFLEPYDIPSLTAFKMAVADINAKGGVNGRQMQLIEADTKSDPAVTGQVAQRLIDKGIDAMLVSCDFDFSAPAAQAAQKAGIPVLGCAGSPKFGVQGIGPMAFTPTLSTYAEGAVLSNFATKKGWSKAFLLVDDTLSYTREVCAGFEKAFKEQGGTIAGQGSFKNSDGSVASQIEAIKSSGADVLMACSYPPGGASALRQIRAAGVDIPILGEMAFEGAYWLKAVPGLSDYYASATASVFGDDPSPAVNTFIKRYEKETGTTPAVGHVTLGYANAQMLARAIEIAGSTNGDAVVKAIEGFDKQDLIIGPTSFSATAHIPLDRPMRIIEYQNGKPRFLETVAPGVKVGLGG